MFQWQPFAEVSRMKKKMENDAGKRQAAAHLRSAETGIQNIQTEIFQILKTEIFSKSRLLKITVLLRAPSISSETSISSNKLRYVCYN